jgi:hypothetical protein
MKNFIIILFFIASVSFINKVAMADACPPISDLKNPNDPPAGWKILVPPVLTEEDYYFSEAVHSLNGSFYYKQVICKYACPMNSCAFAIISTKTYELPNTKMPPWHYPSTIGATLTCRPPSHQPDICIFQ